MYFEDGDISYGGRAVYEKDEKQGLDIEVDISFIRRFGGDSAYHGALQKRQRTVVFLCFDRAGRTLPNA